MGSSPCEGGLIDSRGHGLEGRAEAPEELLAVAGGRGEYQGRGSAHIGTRITFEKQGVSGKNGFDLARPDTYYTRPMSPPWSKPLEVDRLADGGADVDFAIPLAELSGLRPLRAGLAGSVQGRAHFTRQRGLAIAELDVCGGGDAAVPALPAADAAGAERAGARGAGAVPRPRRRACRRILSRRWLPADAPVSASSSPKRCCSACRSWRCTRAKRRATRRWRRWTQQAPPEETHRPFAQLADLLKR